MVVQAVRLIISDDDCALVPVRALRDGIDLVGDQGF